MSNGRKIKSSEEYITYSTDYNILFCHQNLLEKFSEDHSIQIQELERKLESLNYSLTLPHSVIQIKTIRKTIIQTEQELYKLKNSSEKELYIERTKDLLQQYEALSKKTKKVAFGKKAPPPDPEEVNKRLLIIQNYLTVAQEFFPLNIIRKIPESTLCSNCSFDMVDIPINENGFQVCPKCSLEKVSLLDNSFGNDSQSSNYVGAGDYSNESNFTKAIFRFEGTQKVNLPEDLEQRLDSYFINQNLPICSEVRDFPLTVDGKKEGTTRILMEKALLAIGYSKYYEDINLICHQLWGWELPSLQHLMDSMMEIYRKTQEVFDRMENKDRQSALNTQYRLFKTLQLLEYPCTHSDFKLLKNETLMKYDNMWKTMCEGAGLPFFPTV
jgi:hypothetical protein